MNKQQIYLSQEVHHLYLKNLSRKNVYCYVLPFHLVQHANTEFMPKMT